MTIRLTADTHFGHDLAARKRGFSSVEAHDEAILAGLVNGANNKTETIIAGDFAFGQWQLSLDLMKQVPGRKHLVLGNHDRAHPGYAAGFRGSHLRAYLEVFDSVTTAMQLGWGRSTLLVSHFPYQGDVGSREDVFTQWRLRDERAILLHGHTHSSQRLTYSRKGTPQLHIGVDAWEYKPVSLDDIMDYYEGKKKNA